MRRRRRTFWNFSSASAHRLAWVEPLGLVGSRSRFYITLEQWDYYGRGGARRTSKRRQYAPTWPVARRKALAFTCAEEVK